MNRPQLIFQQINALLQRRGIRHADLVLRVMG
jgi:hypothetical protein